ncbi:phosphate ABC transporter permease PstA [Brevibacillus fluminis]|uniref:Phosphate transport system permease protein PstA n=1 Tax=Brevibacillus fluminis TaxID=511487 RepID=A0A3M8DR72_9BACL|nr:phosphate ABC transporter permease PstA [Brevibacillus fluminis]RNB89945.1 phosphate ABC transporter permease PstA [Brevibacillus fluminis]
MSKQVLSRKNGFSRFLDRIATILFWAMGIGAITLVGWLLYTILSKGLPTITWDFLIKLPEEIDAGGGIGPVLFNSFYVLALSLLCSLPIGIGAGIYLAEYAPSNRFTGFIRMCVESLASVPSIVFGLFGLALFVGYFQVGLTIIGGAVSLAFLNLPVLTRVTEESIRAVPKELREASYAMGATKFQCIRTVVLPAALSGIITGISLVAGRAYGESAVIILTAGTTTSGAMWDFSLFSPGETLAVHLWYVQSEAIVEDAREIADKSAAVLVFVVLLLNFLLRIPVWISERKFKMR